MSRSEAEHADRVGQPRGLPTLLVGMVLIVAIVGSLGAPLVPVVAREYKVTIPTAQWSLTLCLLVGALASPLIGRLGYGRRQRSTALGTLAIVAVGCLIAAVPGPFALLLVGRAMQGVGFGIVPLAIVVAGERFGPAQGARMIELLSITAIAGAGVGYPISGLAAQWAGLSGSFLWGGAVAGLVTLAATRWLPSSHERHASRIELGSVLLLGIALTLLFLSVSEVAQSRSLAGPVAFLALSSVVVATAWARRELTRPRPLVDLRLLPRPRVLAANLAAAAAGVVAYLLMSDVARLIQAPRESGGLAHGVLVASCAMIPFSVVSVAGTSLLARVRRHRELGLGALAVGLTMFAVAMAWFGLAHSSLVDVCIALGIAGIGACFTFAAIPGIIASAVPASEVGSVVGFCQVLRMTSYAGGSALSAVAAGLALDPASTLPGQATYRASAATGVVLSLGAAAVCWVLRGRALRDSTSQVRCWGPHPARLQLKKMLAQEKSSDDAQPRSIEPPSQHLPESHDP